MKNLEAVARVLLLHLTISGSQTICAGFLSSADENSQLTRGRPTKAGFTLIDMQRQAGWLRLTNCTVHGHGRM